MKISSKWRQTFLVGLRHQLLLRSWPAVSLADCVLAPLRIARVVLALPQRIWWESVDKACHAREYPKSQLGPFKPRYRPFRNVLFLTWIVSRPRSRGRRRPPSSPAGVGWAVVACGRSDPAPSLLRWLPAAPGRAGPGASLPQERFGRPTPSTSASSVCLSGAPARGPGSTPPDRRGLWGRLVEQLGGRAGCAPGVLRSPLLASVIGLSVLRCRVLTWRRAQRTALPPAADDHHPTSPGTSRSPGPWGRAAGAEPAPAGTCTRAVATDPASRQRFRRYWAPMSAGDPPHPPRRPAADAQGGRASSNPRRAAADCEPVIDGLDLQSCQ